MSKPTKMGKNLTGAQMAPDRTAEMEEGAAAVVNPSLELDGLQEERILYSRNAEPIGTLPPPGTVKAVLKTSAAMLKGERINVFLDTLGERLAFERTGTRLYDALLVKHAAADLHENDPSREELLRIRNQEQAHFFMLIEAMETLGADPTAITPSADVAAVAGAGVLQVVTDPRVTLTEALKAILIAELVDNDGWAQLTELAHELGQTDLAKRFEAARLEEEEHLALVRLWLNAAVKGQAGLSPAPAGKPKTRQPAAPRH